MSKNSSPPPAFDIIGIGAATLDVLALVDHFPTNDSVQPAHAHSLCGGGPVATALCTASHLGLRTALIDAIGNDWIGAQILSSLNASNIHTNHVNVTSDATSPISSILVRRSDAARAIAFTPSTAPPPTLTAATVQDIASARLLHINGRHPDACRAAITIARNHNTIISFDGGAGRYREEILDLFQTSAITIVSHHFAHAATGIDDPAHAASKIAQNPSNQITIVTAGIQGSWLATPDAIPHHQPAFLLDETIDTTGAGDVFHGAFLTSFLAGATPAEAQRFAAAAAVLSTTALGGRAAIPNTSTIRSLLVTH